MTAKKRKPIVYSVVNTINGDEYIGLTSRLLCQRRGGHLSYALKHNSQTHFHRAIRKYGAHSFKWTIVLECDDYDAAKLGEIRLISERKPRYNMTVGGDGVTGFRPTPEQIERGAAKRRGRPGPWLGRELPQSFLAGGAAWRISDAGRASWKKHRAAGPMAGARPVTCLNDGKCYESVSKAARVYDIDGASITEICRKKTRRFSVRGLVFRYSSDPHGGAAEAEAVIAAARSRKARRGQPRYIKQVICMNDGGIFASVKEAAGNYGLSSDTVIASCKHRHVYDRKNKPIFSYLEEYRRSID